MKYLLACISLLFISLQLSAQDKVSTKTGKVTFEATKPSFEEIKATHTNVTVVLNKATGELATLALVKGFKFKVALMEEHFNENYVESSKFPKTTFRGKIEGFDVTKLSETPKKHTVKGKMELHGVTQDIVFEAMISIKKGVIHIQGDYSVKASDFKIEIPSVVEKKISNDVKIYFDIKL
jgi:polyisoprenoid-binding protein YceI